MPPPPVRKHSARGRISQLTAYALDKMIAMGYDPIESMVLLATGQAVCSYCEGKGCHTVARLHDPEICNGEGKERVPLEIRAKMVIESAQYVYPKRKAIEIGASDPSDTQDTKNELVNQIIMVLDGESEEVPT